MRGGVGTKNKYQGKYKDDKSDVDYKTFVFSTIANALKKAKDDAHFFYWCDEKYIWLIQQSYQDLGIANKRVCLWIKNSQNPVPQIAFNKVYEPCVYGVKGSPYLNRNYKTFNEVLNQEISTGNDLQEEIFDLINLWVVKRQASNEYQHPTQKPITLHEKPIKRCTAVGDIIIDLFGGSGSTLMACQQLQRKARIMEIDPIFCQVIIDRWQKMTGLTAQKVL